MVIIDTGTVKNIYYINDDIKINVTTNIINFVNTHNYIFDSINLNNIINNISINNKPKYLLIAFNDNTSITLNIRNYQEMYSDFLQYTNKKPLGLVPICQLNTVIINYKFKEYINNYLYDIKQNNDTIIITYIDKKYFDIFKIFYQYFKKLNKNNLLVIALDNDVYNKLINMNIKTILFTNCDYIVNNRDCFWRHRLNHIRILFECLEMNIIHTDSDCIWLRDITSILNNKNYNIIGQIEYGHPKEVSSKYGFIMCCGFFKLNYSLATLALLEDIMNSKINDDQVLFNFYMFKNAAFIINNTNNDEYFSRNIYLNNNITIGLLKDQYCSRDNKFNNLYIYHPWLPPSDINDKIILLNKLLDKI